MPRIEVELARAIGDDVRIDRLALDAGATVGDALALAQRLGLVDAGALGGLAMGVFGRACTPSHPLEEGDRIELTAALQVDPKVARQRRVAKRRAALPRDKWNPAR